jgi:hypothetical protein
MGLEILFHFKKKLMLFWTDKTKDIQLMYGGVTKSGTLS